MEKTLKFLKECGTFYIATVENAQPRVRPFGAVTDIEGKLYIVTNNQKPVYKQMIQNPKIEISGMNGNGVWIRCTAEVSTDPRREAKLKMLEDQPELKSMYNADDGIMEVLYLRNAKSTFASFSGFSETEEF